MGDVVDLGARRRERELEAALRRLEAIVTDLGLPLVEDEPDWFHDDTDDDEGGDGQPF